MRDIGRSLVNQLQRFRFEHETKEFLVRFRLKNDGFSVEAFVQEDFVWRKCSEALVTEYETIVNISDVPNEQMMIGEELVEGAGPNLFTDGDT